MMDVYNCPAEKKPVEEAKETLPRGWGVLLRTSAWQRCRPRGTQLAGGWPVRT